MSLYDAEKREEQYRREAICIVAILGVVLPLVCWLLSILSN